jgi:DNA polymerase-3 subunit delta
VKYFVDLLNSLKQGVVFPAYLFYGEEVYLREQAVARFRELLLPAGMAEWNLDLVDGEEITPREIVFRAGMLPFLSQKRLVVVKNAPFFKTGRRSGEETGEETKVSGKEAVLLDYLADPLSSTCLIFTTGEAVDKRRKIFRAVKEVGQAVEFTFLRRPDLARWLAKRAGRDGKRFAPEAVDALLAIAGSSLQVLAGELEKIVNFTGNREIITIEDIRQVVACRVEENIFAVVDAIAGRQCRAALNGIRELLAAREPPQRILSMVARQFRLILLVRELLQEGYQEKDLAGQIKLHPYAARKALGQSHNFSRPLLEGILEELLDIDVSVKMGRQEFYPAMEMLLLKLCADATDSCLSGTS